MTMLYSILGKFPYNDFGYMLFDFYDYDNP